MSLVAEIAVSGTAYSFDMLFSYAVPENFSVKCGCRTVRNRKFQTYRHGYENQFKEQFKA